MKKLIALLLAVLMLFALTACKPAQPEEKTEEPEKTAEPEEPEQSEEPEAPAELSELGKLVVLNTALEDLEYSADEDARFNAYWLKGYSAGQYVADNFWFQPAEDAVAAQISYEDGYTFEADYADFVNQVISLDIPADLAENYEMIVCGPESQKDYFPYHVGYILIGNEAILFMKEDGYKVTDVFEAIGMTDAEEYDFVCADDYTETIAKEDLAEVEIFFTENGTVDSSSIAYPEYTLANIRYIVASDVTKESAPEAEQIVKLNVFANGVGVIDAEPAAEGYFGGNMYNCYKISELLAACELPEAKTVTTISYADGATMDEDYALFAQKYISLDTSKDRQPWTMGKVQERNAYIANAGYYIMDSNAFVYVPDACTEEAGLALTGILKTMKMENAAACDIVCSDGYTETVEAADFADVFVFHIDGRVDATSIANPGYTLYNALYIIPKG